MKLIRHRVNTLTDLLTLESGWGAEVDLRSQSDQIILQHDPFKSGDRLEDFLNEWGKKDRGTLILNPKEDGLETQVLEGLRKRQIEDFFFLDLPLPTVVRLCMKERMKKVALRISEYEPLSTVAAFEGKAQWCWIDCFSGNPPRESTLREARKNFRTCLVSPELQSYPVKTIKDFRFLREHLDAVCTKRPDLWR